MINTWARKILKTVYGPEAEQRVWRVRTNKKLRELYNIPDLVVGIKRRSI
jgi:hypothetical protein